MTLLHFKSKLSKPHNPLQDVSFVAKQTVLIKQVYTALYKGLPDSSIDRWAFAEIEAIDGRSGLVLRTDEEQRIYTLSSLLHKECALVVESNPDRPAYTYISVVYHYKETNIKLDPSQRYALNQRLPPVLQYSLHNQHQLWLPAYALLLQRCASTVEKRETLSYLISPIATGLKALQAQASQSHIARSVHKALGQVVAGVESLQTYYNATAKQQEASRAASVRGSTPTLSARSSFSTTRPVPQNTRRDSSGGK